MGLPFGVICMLNSLLIVVPNLLLGVVLHEVAHGWVAYLLGDPTAKQRGRLTLNPISHIDPMLTIVVPAFLIFAGSPIVVGGAKPVPVNPRFFVNPKVGMGLVAIAGPLVNFFLMFLAIVGIHLYMLFFAASLPFWVGQVVCSFFMGGVLINLILGVFNLTPVPPLDGGRIIVSLLPGRYAQTWAKLEPYGFLILIGLLMLGVIGPILNKVVQGVLILASFPEELGLFLQ